MDKLQELSENIFNKVRERGDVYDAEWIANSISYFWQDATKVLKNINETSVNPDDRGKRLIKLEEDFGLSKTYIF